MWRYYWLFRFVFGAIQVKALVLPRETAAGGSVGSALELARARGAPVAKWLGRLKSYYVPPSMQSGKDPGLWLLLHACQAAGDDWFGGLPEESTIAEELLRRGFGLLALQATSGICWSAGEEVLIAEALTAFGPRPSKLYGLGISSGGEALSLLAVERRAVFDGLVFDVSPASALVKFQAPFSLPPTAFIYMPQDKGFATQGAVESAKDSLVKAGTRVALYPTWPQPVDPSELCARLPQLGLSLCDTIVKALLVHHKLLEKRDGGRYYFKWMGAIKGVTASSADYANNALRMLQPSLKAVLSDRLLRAVSEEFKRFEGLHTPVADHFASAADFVTSGGATEPIEQPQVAVSQCARSRPGLPADFAKQRRICVPESFATQLQKESSSVSFTSYLCDCLFTGVSVCPGGGVNPYIVGYNGAIVNLTVPSKAQPSQWLKTAKKAICAEKASHDAPGSYAPGFGAAECAACAPWDPFKN